MSAPPAPRGTQTVTDATTAWQEVRADKSIQFEPTPLQLDHDISGRVPDLPVGSYSPQPGPMPSMGPAQAPDPASLPPPPAPKPPPEPSMLGDWLRSIFEPIGKALGLAWPVMQWVLIVLAAVLVAYAVYRVLAPWLDRYRAACSATEQGAVDPGWAHDRGEAQQLLDEADVLAAEGRYGDAAHLLLQRSVGQIARARPDWVLPASTTREISAIPALPTPARSAFQLIAQRVERSLFALRPLDQADWHAARAAYADFALQELTQEPQR